MTDYHDGEIVFLQHIKLDTSDGNIRLQFVLHRQQFCCITICKSWEQSFDHIGKYIYTPNVQFSIIYYMLSCEDVYNNTYYIWRYV